MYKFSYFYKHEDSRWHSFKANDMKEVRDYLQSIYNLDDADFSFHITNFDYLLAEMLSFELERISFEFKNIIYIVEEL